MLSDALFNLERTEMICFYSLLTIVILMSLFILHLLKAQILRCLTNSRARQFKDSKMLKCL